MKKSLIKAIMIATILFCSNARTWRENNCNFDLIKTIECTELCKLKKNYKYKNSYTIMYGLQTNENLKAHHYGLKFFNSDHIIPNTNDIINSIHSHPNFIGKFAKEEVDFRYLCSNAKSNLPFFIYEISKNENSDFFMVHKKERRHFIINKSSDLTAVIDNGNTRRYPNLNSFIKCTLCKFI